MPISTGSLIVVAMGSVAISGFAFYVYQKKKNSIIRRDLQHLPQQKPLVKQIVQPSKTASSAAARLSRTFILCLIKLFIFVLRQLTIFEGGLVTRECKMIFVVNRPILTNKQNLFVAVSTACLHCYRLASSDKSNDAFMKPWLKMGQMKVVVKGQNSRELLEISEEAKKLHLPFYILRKDKLKWPMDEQMKCEPNELLVTCIVGPTKDLNKITGHLKLL